MRNSLLYGDTCGTANTYYYDHHGEFSLVRPTSSFATVKAAREFDLDDYTYRSLNGVRPHLENGQATAARASSTSRADSSA